MRKVGQAVKQDIGGAVDRQRATGPGEAQGLAEREGIVATTAIAALEGYGVGAGRGDIAVNRQVVVGVEGQCRYAGQRLIAGKGEISAQGLDNDRAGALERAVDSEGAGRIDVVGRRGKCREQGRVGRCAEGKGGIRFERRVAGDFRRKLHRAGRDVECAAEETIAIGQAAVGRRAVQCLDQAGLGGAGHGDDGIGSVGGAGRRRAREVAAAGIEGEAGTARYRSVAGVGVAADRLQADAGQVGIEAGGDAPARAREAGRQGAG